MVQVNSITAHVNKLAVAPEARRKGLATRLLQVRTEGGRGVHRQICCFAVFSTTTTQLAALHSTLNTQAVLQLAISERRVQCATLHVDVRNEAALGLYTKAGFVKVISLRQEAGGLSGVTLAGSTCQQEEKHQRHACRLLSHMLLHAGWHHRRLLRQRPRCPQADC